MDLLPLFLTKEGVVAVGEIGYDDQTPIEDKFFRKQLELATKELALAELAYETKFNEIYIETKDGGGSDTYGKAKSQSHPDCVALHQAVIDRKSVVGFLKSHLKAWDRIHDNAQNRGHTLRKELDKLNKDIYHKKEDGLCEAEDFLGK